MSPRLGIVLVNWNGWSDTVECLESVLRGTLPVHVVVVDNASHDGSIARIAEWSAGRCDAVAAAPAMQRLSSPPIAKPVAMATIDAATALASPPADVPLTIIDAGANLGFAGGNNLGIRHLLRDPQIDYVWLLNNDTVVEPDAAAALLTQLDATPKVGMCGTVVRFYHSPGQVQCLNGSRFNRWTANSTGIGIYDPISVPFDTTTVVKQTDFVVGASLAVSRQFVASVGLMEEAYFLYFEEIDWAYRNAGRFATGFARGAIVYHKEGGSIGSSSVAGGRSQTSEYYQMRAKLMFVRRHQPVLLAWHWLLALAQIGRRLLRRQPEKAVVMLRALFGLSFAP